MSNKDATLAVTYDGLTLYSTISSSCGDVDGMAKGTALEASFLLRKLMGPRTGIDAYRIGDAVTNREGEQEIVFTVDRVNNTIGLEFQGPANEPISQWTPLWTTGVT